MDEKTITKEILKKRTEQLARSKEIEQIVDQESLELIVFALGDESYALEAKALKSIRSPREIVPLPGVASFVKGIINLSGIVYSVIDLKILLGLKKSESSEHPNLLIVDHEKLKICFLVDQIIGFKTINEKKLDTDIARMKGLETDLIKGLTTDTLVVLSAQKILEKIVKESK